MASMLSMVEHFMDYHNAFYSKLDFSVMVNDYYCFDTCMNCLKVYIEDRAGRVLTYNEFHKETLREVYEEAGNWLHEVYEQLKDWK